MSILHSQLAIFGAIDELVIEARKGNRGEADQKVLTAAAQLLPNSTGFGQAGWYRQLEGFLNTPGIRNEIRTRVLPLPGRGDRRARARFRHPGPSALAAG